MRVCIVSSCGGHLTEVRALAPAYSQYAHFYVIDDAIALPSDMQGRTYNVTHSERDWKTLVNIVEAFRILRRERPDVLLSTGAGLAVSFSLIGRLFFGTRVIFVETMARVTQPSLTGRIMYHLAHDFFYQWEGLQRYFPRGICAGPMI